MPAVYHEYHCVALQIVVFPHVAVTAGSCDELRLERRRGDHACYSLGRLPDMSMAVKLMFAWRREGGGGWGEEHTSVVVEARSERQ